MNAKEKMIKYGAGVLSPAELIGVVIGNNTVAESIAAIARGKLIHQKQEHVLAILCNTKMECESVETVAIGGLTQCIADPREIFAPAVRKRAAAIVLVHNHPSGYCEPSQDDLELTRRCIDAGKVLGIKVVDHVIVSDTGYKSLHFSEMYDLNF